MEIIGIDHGNKQIKTRTQVFTSGLSVSLAEPGLPGNHILYNGKYYMLSEKRLDYRRDKAESDDFLVLTLFALVKELEERKLLSQASPGLELQVGIGAGLPPSHYGTQKTIFRNYLSRGRIAFHYNHKPMAVEIEQVRVYPQGYAGILSRHTQIRSYSKAILIDIGGYTVIPLRLQNGRPDMETAKYNLEKGVIRFYDEVIAEINASFDYLLEENDVDTILLHRAGRRLYPNEIKTYIESSADRYIQDIGNALRERGFDLKASLTFFLGGGSILFKHQILRNKNFGTPCFIDDIHANAIGYETMYRVEEAVRDVQ